MSCINYKIYGALKTSNSIFSKTEWQISYVYSKRHKCCQKHYRSYMEIKYNRYYRRLEQPTSFIHHKSWKPVGRKQLVRNCMVGSTIKMKGEQRNDTEVADLRKCPHNTPIEGASCQWLGQKNPTHCIKHNKKGTGTSSLQKYCKKKGVKGYQKRWKPTRNRLKFRSKVNYNQTKTK